MAELQQLQDFEIPAGREALRGNHAALLRVADFCEDNYVQATDKRKALEETMAFTTQALASVAYQVGNLAGHTLRMLDLQGTALRQVEARVSALGQGRPWAQTPLPPRPGSQMVNMHLEKVARREIGTLAAVQRLYPGQKVLAPESLAPPPPYCRRPINFSCLDHVGHGIKDLSTQLSRTGTLSRRSIKAPATPTAATLGRAPRIPEPVQPPALPDGRLSAASSASSLASAGADGVAGAAPPKPQAMAPPPPPPCVELCPPPPELTPELEDLGLPPPPPGFGLEEPSWAPDAYLEKVVTLYPYTRQKDNELSFTEGTIICVTRRYSDGWCEGVSAEGAGFFPGNYVVPGC
ncbi:ABI gene family member 3 isoform X2 [Heterocephalus glaber]|uniref:ABI gene family member 3 n=1 Tax=Heterocephalus glaber TaxID=10181 RepID=A0AAX6REV6_HETGA|nr:ABI gene family member 3 isoform X2 [Heterocephalus glaber]